MADEPTLLKIAQLGQPVLRREAAEVPAERIGSPEFQRFLSAMFDTLRHEKGAGLAAPQVFVSLRVFIAAIEFPEGEDAPPVFETFINPEIEPIGAEIESAWEGCLSFAELLVLVPRHRAVSVRYLNAQGEPSTLGLAGLPARGVQHEFDHIEGIVTIDRAESSLDIVKASEIDAARAARGE